MKKFLIGSIMIAAFCVLTAGSVSSVTAQEVTLTKETTDLNTDLAIQTKLTDPTPYEFEITYDGDGDTTEVIIKDTVPAEWNVTYINGIPVNDTFNDKNTPNTFDIGGGTDNVTVFRSGRDKRSSGKKPRTSSTKICWKPFNPLGSETLTVTVETRKSPSGKLKYAPTSCGLLELNNGAIAYVLPLTEPPVIHAQSDPLDPLVAVEDLDGVVGVIADGIGDEDGDGLTDADEVLIHGTSPCSDDTDGDGLTDEVEVAGCTDPLNADSDGDTLPDGFEVDTYDTDPCLADTDGDGCNDNLDTDPVFQDPDADGDGVVGGCDADDNDPAVQ